MVATSSIEAYYSLDHSTQRGRVAAEILSMTRAGQRAFIRILASRLGLDKSAVSGRLNELKEKPFEYMGKWYRLEFTGKVEDYHAGQMKRPETWAMVLCQKPGEQIALFQ